MRTFVCLECFCKFESPFRGCKNPSCEVKNPDRYQRYSRRKDYKVRPEMKTAAGSPVAGAGEILACTCSNANRYILMCPKCHYPLPDALDNYDDNTLTISLVGARSSGKTVYMYSLIKSLEIVAKNNGVSFSLDPKSQSDFQQLYEAPIKKNQVLQATSTEKQPLIRAIFKSPDPNIPSYKIVIQDVAGEHVQESSTVNPELEYLGESDLVLVLWDPYLYQPLMNQLRGVVEQGSNIQGKKAKDIISIITEQYVTEQNMRTKIALLFGKFDLIHSLCYTHVEAYQSQEGFSTFMKNRTASYMLDDSLMPGYKWSPEDAEILDSDTRSLLKGSNDGALDMAIASFKNKPYLFKVFPVSALGQSPKGDYLQDVGISPFRCTDPIQWGYYMKFGKGLFW